VATDKDTPKPKRRRRKIKTIPLQLEREIDSPTKAVKEAMGNPAIRLLIQSAVGQVVLANERTLDDEASTTSVSEAWSAARGAVTKAAALAREDERLAILGKALENHIWHEVAYWFDYTLSWMRDGDEIGFQFGEMPAYLDRELRRRASERAARFPIVWSGPGSAELAKGPAYRKWQGELFGLKPSWVGRSNGDGRWVSPEVFHSLLEEALADWKSKFHDRLTNRLLARRLGVDEGTIRDTLKDPRYGPPFDTLYQAWERRQGTSILAACKELGWLGPR
jgi:hypothetical protein